MKSAFFSAFARSLLQIGGAAIGIPAAAHDPFSPDALAGLVVAAGGFAWSQYAAARKERLRKAVNEAPTLPSASEVERGEA